MGHLGSEFVTFVFRELGWKCQQRFGTFILPNFRGMVWVKPPAPNTDTPLDCFERAMIDFVAGGDDSDCILYLDFRKWEAILIQKSWATIRPSHVWATQSLVLCEPQSDVAQAMVVVVDGRQKRWIGFT